MCSYYTRYKFNRIRARAGGDEYQMGRYVFCLRCRSGDAPMGASQILRRTGLLGAPHGLGGEKLLFYENLDVFAVFFVHDINKRTIHSTFQ
jgi:hypothetical protein